MMKRTYIFLIIAALCAIGVSAKTIYIWHNGIKTELPIHTNDSITFDKGSSPVMHIWRNDSEIYQFTLAVNDSITYSKDMTETAFDYDHWMEQKTVPIYSHEEGKWKDIYLPWADVAATVMPDQYRYPMNDVATDGNCVWELAFNLMSDPDIEGVHMFGLWERKSSYMRIYAYLETLPNENANYCYFTVTSSDTKTPILDRDALMWFPSDSIMKRHSSWQGDKLPAGAIAPSENSCQILPITGIVDGTVNKGWLCYELKFNSGIYSEISSKSSIGFTLSAVQQIDFTGAMEISAQLTQTDGSITIPGHKYSVTSAWFKAAGSLLSGIGSGVGMLKNGKDAAGGDIGPGTAGGWGAGLGIVGALGSFVGNAIDAAHAGDDKTYKVDLNFALTDTAKLTGQLKSVLGSTISPVSISYERFFEGVFNHLDQTKAPKKAKGDDDTFPITIGAWNLKRQPVLYVCNDAGYATPLRKEDAFIYSNSPLYATFLDPSSIELQLNEDNILFDVRDVDSVKIVACDFAFVSDKYNIDALPYYDFYGIPRASVDAATIEKILFPCGDEGYMRFLLDTTAEYQTFVNDKIGYGQVHNFYTGIAAQMPEESGMDGYDIVYTPTIGQYSEFTVAHGEPCSTYPTDNPFHRIGVSVILELTFKSGEKRFFSERFLPEIKAFSLFDALTLKEQFQSISAPTTVNNIPLTMPLFDMQKEKALRVLEPFCNVLTGFSLVKTGDNEYGIRIREWQDEEHPGIIIETKPTTNGLACRLESQLQFLHDYLQEINAWDAVNTRLEQFSMPSLDNCYWTTTNLDRSSYNIQTGEYCDKNNTTILGIRIFKEDADGNLQEIYYVEDIQ